MIRGLRIGQVDPRAIGQATVLESRKRNSIQGNATVKKIGEQAR